MIKTNLSPSPSWAKPKSASTPPTNAAVSAESLCSRFWMPGREAPRDLRVEGDYLVPQRTTKYLRRHQGRWTCRTINNKPKRIFGLREPGAQCLRVRHERSRATLIHPGIAELLTDSTIIPRSIRPSSSRDSSIPFLLKTFTPENSGGLCDAVTENPSSQLLRTRSECHHRRGNQPELNRVAPTTCDRGSHDPR